MRPKPSPEHQTQNLVLSEPQALDPSSCLVAYTPCLPTSLPVLPLVMGGGPIPTADTKALHDRSRLLHHSSQGLHAGLVVSSITCLRINLHGKRSCNCMTQQPCQIFSQTRQPCPKTALSQRQTFGVLHAFQISCRS